MLPTLDRIRARFSRRLVFKLSHPSLTAHRRPIRPADSQSAVDRPRVGTDAALARLAERITPSPERLRAIRAKLPPSTISYDDEEGQPF